MTTTGINMNISRAKNREELVRMLAMLRLRSDLEASAKGISEHAVLNFSADELEALPESLISHIIDDYLIMKNNGVKDEQIFKSLDMQRTIEGNENVSIPSNNLTHYIKQRLRIDFPRISSLDEKIIEMETLYTLYWFTKETRSKADWQKADAFAAKVIRNIQQQHIKAAEQAEAAASHGVAAAQEAPPQPTAETVEHKKSYRLLIWLAILAVIIAAAAYWFVFMAGSALPNWSELLPK